MPRMMLGLLCWLFVCCMLQQGHFGKLNYQGKTNRCKARRNVSLRPGVPDAKRCMEKVRDILKGGNPEETFNAIESLEELLQETYIDATTSLSTGNVVALLHKSKGRFKGLQLFASDNEVMADRVVAKSRVSVQLPEELQPRSNETIVFCMLNVTEMSLNLSNKLYESRFVGLSLPRKVSGLREHVNITTYLTTSIRKNETPVCHFYDFSTRVFNQSGCNTELHKDQGTITCSCDHLTYFGILLVSSDVSEEDQQIMTYITVIGCSLSLFSLVIAVLLFVMNSKMRADVSLKIHVNVAIALILLNIHFLPSQAVAALPSNGVCLYIAIGLHYSLLTMFTWMALEGFHLYLLLVKVFNIYVRRYLLKLCLVGWGIPAVIVSVVVIIDRDWYGRVFIDTRNSNTTAICYITNDTVKSVTVLGVFCLVFFFNVVMFGVTMKQVVNFHFTTEYGQSIRQQAKRGVCTLLGLSIYLGITWGLIFFSFGYLATPSLYLFCILNSLQGFFIFLWFVMSLKKIGESSTKTSSEPHSTNSKP